jgi:hypothetical protein
MSEKCYDPKDNVGEDISTAQKVLGTLKSIPPYLDANKTTIGVIAGGAIFPNIVEGIGKQITKKAAKGSLKFGSGRLLKTLGSRLNVIGNVADVLDIVDLIQGQKWTKFPDKDLMFDIFRDVKEELLKDPITPELTQCLRDSTDFKGAEEVFKNTFKKEVNREPTAKELKDFNDTLSAEVDGNIEIIKNQFKKSAPFVVQKTLPDYLDPRGDLFQDCMPIKYNDYNKMILPGGKCPIEYKELFKQYMGRNYPNIQLIEKEKFSFLNNKMQYIIPSKAASDLASKAIKESTQKALKESTQKALKESTEKALKEATQKAIQESTGKALKESTQKAIRESAQEGLSKTAKESIAKTAKEGLSKSIKEGGATAVSKSKSFLGSAADFVKKNPKLTAAGLTAAGLATYAAATGQSVGEAAGELASSITSEVADQLNDLGCEVTGVCPSDFIKDIIDKVKKYGLYVGIIIAILIILFIVKNVVGILKK